jgi:hypothetical protein
MTQPTLERLTELRLTPELQRIINEAFVPRDLPFIMAHVDEQGRPSMSWRGSTIALNQTQMAVWARHGDGATVTSLEKRPDVMFAYRESGGPGQRSIAVLNIRGKARIDRSDEVRKQVYGLIPQRERDGDPEMAGVAIIIDVESVGGIIPGYILQMRKERPE